MACLVCTLNRPTNLDDLCVDCELVCPNVSPLYVALLTPDADASGKRVATHRRAQYNPGEFKAREAANTKRSREKRRARVRARLAPAARWFRVTATLQRI